MTPNGMRRSSSVPPSNPFWSDRAQGEHVLQHLRPLNLDAHSTPIPQDDDLESPRPLQGEPSGQQGGELGEQTAPFETPGAAQPEKPQSMVLGETESNEGTKVASMERGHDEDTGKKPERAWKRRAQGGVTHNDEIHGKNECGEKRNSSVEDELGEQVLQHFQQETARLQSQNDKLMREIQQLKEQKDQQSRLAAPSSWVGHASTLLSPPRKAPPTHETMAWMSPESFNCTPNGTRVPSGPPPPDPPPLPAWPPELSNYECALEPPRKFRGVLGEAAYRVGGGACTPRTARNFWLEQEVASLREKLHSEAMRSRSFQGSYWSRPFQTEAEKARDDQEAVTYMRRNVASGMSDVLHGQRHRDTEYHQDRADAALVFGSHLLEGRAGPEQAFGDPRLHARAGPEQAHGESRLPDRAHMASELGDHFGGARACSVTAFGDQCHGARADQAAKHVLGDQCHGARADDAAMHELGEVYQQDRAGIQHQLGGAPHHSRALRQDREVVEDGDLKGIPIQLPTLTSPDGRDASLEAGDWLIQLEPLIGDLSKNAASWWRRVMDATTSTYARWLHADPLSRLKIAAPENGALSSGFERLDQRVTSLLLQSVPKAIKDEVIATRELSTTAILFRVMRTFQPGGLLEKSRLLEDLTTIPVVKSNQDVVAALRLWKRKASRASELCAQLPDPLLLVRTLDGIAKPVVENSSQANFRIATFRMNCSLDIRPSLDNVWLFFDLLLAEAEVAIHSTTTASPTEAKTPTKAAVKALQGSATTRTTTTGANVWPCKFWMSEAGCRQGQRCRWPHPWEGVSDRASRCANCSSTQHLQADCPAKAQVKPPVGGEGGENREETGAGVKN